MNKHNCGISMLMGSILILSFLLSSCIKGSKTEGDEDFPYHGFPVITVFFVPLDGVSKADVEKLKDDFYEKFAEKQWEPYIVETLEHMSTPDSCYNDTHTRFRANKIIKTLSKTYSKNCKKKVQEKYPKNWAYYIIGVTDRDISTNVHGKSDYGILGLSYLGKEDASIISTYRLKRKKDLWKLATHEFCHGFYGCPHCKNDNPHCLMADAKGGNPHFEIKDSLCIDCKNICLIGD